MSAVYISLSCLLHLYAVSQTVGLAVLDEACASLHEMKMYTGIHALPAHIKHPFVVAGVGISSRLTANGDASYVFKVAVKVYWP
jgi:hypothetical protein